MNLKEKIREDLKEAMKAKDEVRVRTLRMVITAIRNFEVEHMKEASDEDVISILRKEAKKRKEALEQYLKGGREDLAREEGEELDVIESYLPRQMSEEEIEELARKVVEEIGADSMKDFGRVMKEMMSRVKGRADGKVVNTVVRKLLGG